MKKLIMLFWVIVITQGVFSQIPQKLSYQGVVRNLNGTLVTDQSIGMKISILQGAPSGAAIFSEICDPNPQTNANGLLTVEIGSGQAVIGSIPGIEWAEGPYFLKTEMDLSGGTNYTIVGTSELLSVPYAQYAKKAANVFSAKYQDLTGKPDLFSGSYLDLTDTPSLFSGFWADIQDKPSTLGGYGISDAMKTSHIANGITSTMITNWNNAYSWGNHSGLYRPLSYVPAWSEITGKPSFANVATTGSYNDLSNKPSIINSQWTTAGSAIHYNSGNVGIGVSSPAYKLEINGGNYSYIKFFNNTSGIGTTDGFVIGTTPSGNPAWIWNYEVGNIHFGINNTNRMIITSDGHIDMMGYLNLNSGISSGSALKVNNAEALWWNGTYFSWGYGGTYNYFADKVTIGNPANPGYMFYVQGTAYATGSWNSSDACFKKNISAIDHSLDKLMKIRGTRFEFRKDEFKDYQFSEGPQFGFIAQELENILPELVNTDSNGYKSVNYNGMIPVLLEALKEQQEIIDRLKTESELIKTENDQVNSRLEKLERLILVLAQESCQF